MLDVKEEKTIANIELELERLWDEQKEKKQIKACLFNLIIYTHEVRRTEYFRKTVQAIIQKFPCRIIFIEGNPSKPDEFIHVDVSTQATGEPGSLVACDQISIETSLEQLKRVPFIVIPHLVPDMPVYLLWGQDPTSESEILPFFKKFATRLIFDSECTEDLQHFSKEILRQIGELKMDFMDMHWALITGWRDIIASLFDTPEKHHQLRITKQFKITYNSRKTDYFHHYETQGIYLQGWLAAQMGWKFQSMQMQGETRVITYSIGSNQVEVQLVPKEHETHPSGALLSLEIDCANDVHFSLSREEKWNKVVSHTSYREKCELPHLYPMPDLERGFTFMREIFFSHPGNHYRNMLQVIAQTDWK